MDFGTPCTLPHACFDFLQPLNLLLPLFRALLTTLVPVVQGGMQWVNLETPLLKALANLGRSDMRNWPVPLAMLVDWAS